MARRPKTAFDRYREQRRKDSELDAEYRQASDKIAAVDAFIRALDDARIEADVSKAELARRIGARPEAVRRLLTAKHANPTLRTVVELASALGLRLSLTRAEGLKSATG